MDVLDSTTMMLRVPCLHALLASTRGSLHAHQLDHSADGHNQTSADIDAAKSLWTLTNNL